MAPHHINTLHCQEGIVIDCRCPMLNKKVEVGITDLQWKAWNIQGETIIWVTWHGTVKGQWRIRTSPDRSTSQCHRFTCPCHRFTCPCHNQHVHVTDLLANYTVCSQRKQGNSSPKISHQQVQKQTPQFCFIYIGYRVPLSLSTIRGNHLPFNQ